jgi:hypothetical protein
MIQRMRARAFGLEIEMDRPIVGLRPVAKAAGARSTKVELVGYEELEDRWRGATARELVRHTGSDGVVAVLAEEDAQHGHRIAITGIGSCIVAPDGRSVAFAPAPATSPWLADRLLTSDALPLAALLQGVEALHAGAVVLDGVALAVAGPSGAGKSSLALTLASLGHPLLSDDALALEPGARPLCLPGPEVANVRDPHLRAVARESLAPFREVLGEVDGALRVLVETARDPAPLGALYLLDRSGAAGALTISPTHDARAVLSATFNRVVDDPRRLMAHLSTCAGIAETASVFTVCVPGGMGPPELADRLVADLRARLPLA